MEEKNKAIQDLKDIKGLMEQSTRFISLSGLSGVFAGIYALIGGSVMWNLFELGNPFIGNDHSYRHVRTSELDLFSFILIVSVAMVVPAFITGIMLTVRKAKKNGQPLLGSASQRLLYNLMLPLVAGGLFSLYLLSNDYIELLIPSTLIFYGLALINASKFTIRDIHALGIVEIALGFLALLVPTFGLPIWMFGFGIMHIVYGLYMYLKYDRSEQA